MTNPSARFGDQHRQPQFYRFWCQDHLRFSDLDMLGHGSSVRVHEFFAQCRTRLFLAALPEWPKSIVLPVLKTQETVHEHEITWPAVIDTGMTIEKWGKTSVTFALAIFVQDHLCVMARNVFVFIDQSTRLPTPPNNDVRAQFDFHIARGH